MKKRQMDLNTISIAKFKQQGLSAASCFNDDIIITDHLENMEQFRFASRIDALTVLVCLKGEIHCHINLKEYKIKPNEILVNFPENIIQIDQMSDLEAYAMLISSDFLRDLHLEFKQKISSYLFLKGSPLISLPFEELSCLKSYYSLIRDNISIIRPESENIVKGLVVSLIYKIISLINAFRVQDEDNGIANKSRIQQSFEKFMSLLGVYHAQEHSVKFYASKLNLTANYLSGIVKDYSGKTASEWINEYVILEAMTLLRFSDMNIQEVAYKLNFSTQSAFGKYFKQKTGISPKNYVKSIR